MKTAVIKKSDSSIVGTYDGSPSQESYDGAWGDSELFAHVEMPSGSDQSWLVITPDGDSYDLTEDIGLKAALQAASALAIGKATMAGYRAFGADLMDRFAIENANLGVTADNMTDTVLNNMDGVMKALLSGSLKEAIRRAKAIPPESKDVKYITDARLLAYVNMIETKLGLTLSESL